MDINCNINIIKNANDNNKLTIFVGAGVSKSSNLPDWTELIKNIKKELGINEKENDYLKIAQLYYLSCGDVVYYQNIKEYFPETIEPTIIQKLIFDLKPANIITTNWDNLLEKTAQDNGFIYDVISKDEHLVQSKLQNHIIKMHGDFRDNNIVFKEDDYINYKNNFPLIENYVKSILSTNSILFVGYSYSDINLKQITKWIQNNSSVIPPMFLVVFKEDKNQSRYLENFGIKTIVIQEEDASYALDSYSNKLATFLTHLNAPQEEYIDVQKMSDFDIVNFVHERLKPLDKLDAILLTQIQTTLTNCRFIYLQKTANENVILLHFHDYMSNDINKKIRDIYKRFKEVLKERKFSENEEYIILEICSILYKANIDGIVISDDTKRNIEFFEISKVITNKINYNEKLLCNFKLDDFETKDNDIKQLMKKAFFHYQRYEFFKAYNLNEKIVKLCLKQQNYIELFLAMFNQNILLKKIQDPWYLEDTQEKDKYQIAQDNMRLKPYNLDEKFYELPKTIQQILHDIKPFVSFDYLYKFVSEVDDELDKKNQQKKVMEDNSGFTWETDITRNYSKQKNIIHFALSNFIMMERNHQYRSINKKLIKISLIRQMQKQFFIFDKMELFAIVKYITYKDLMELLKEFDGINFNFSTKTINWLIIKVFSNIVKLFNGDNSLYSHFTDELKNILYLCTLQKLTKKQTQIVLEQTRILISNSKINLDIYELINRLIEGQDNININDLLDILEMMINKIICNKGKWDYEAIGNNYFWSPFKHLHEQKIVYENFSLIEKLLKELENYPDEQKIQLSKGFLINIYNISNDNIKQLIKDFMLSIELGELSKLKLDDLTAYDEYSLKISFKLFLAIKKFIEIDNDFINDIKLYALRKISNYVGEITNQVNYLVEKRDIKDLEEPLTHLREFINKISQERKYRSHSMII